MRVITPAAQRSVKIARRKSPYTSVSNALIEDPELSDSGFRLYAALCKLADDSGALMRSGDDIAKAMGGSSARARRRAQTELVKLGYLKVEEKHGSAGRQGWNLYTVHDQVTPISPSTSNDASSRAADSGRPRGDETDRPDLRVAESGRPGEDESGRDPLAESGRGSRPESAALGWPESAAPINLDGENNGRHLGDLPTHCRHGEALKRNAAGVSICALCRVEERARRAAKASGS
jgi:hypothetical protein